MGKKVCSKCGREKDTGEFYPRPERPIGLSSSCRECKGKHKSARYRKVRVTDPEQSWTKRAFGWAKARAKKKGLQFTLVLQDVQAALAEVLGYCPYCDVALHFQRTIQTRRDSPTLDRLNPKLGYVAANITVCCYRCNATKNDADVVELRKLADRIEGLLNRRSKGASA
jgi:hypothetical protein